MKKYGILPPKLDGFNLFCRVFGTNSSRSEVVEKGFNRGQCPVLCPFVDILAEDVVFNVDELQIVKFK